VIGLPTNTQVWLAAGVTDMRRGMHSLAALVQTTLLSEPFSGHIFAFRGRRGDLIKLLWWSGDGLCLFVKKLERGKFVWPQATTGTVHLTGAQLSMLLEGINWKRPERTWQPQVMVQKRFIYRYFGVHRLSTQIIIAHAAGARSAR
jgi:transposase